MTHHVVPGQMWRWSLNTLDGGWFCQLVTTEARHDPGAVVFSVILRDDVFTVIATDDAGPCQYSDLDTFVSADDDSWVSIKPPAPPKRWHVVLLNASLVWICDTWLEYCELLLDLSQETADDTKQVP